MTSRFGKRAILLALALLVGVIVALILQRLRRDFGVGNAIKDGVRLESVSNASGLSLVRREGRLLVATVDEVDEWTGGDDRPPLVTLSDPATGVAVGGEWRVAEFGEVEALAVRDGQLAFPFKTNAQAVSVHWNGTDTPLVDAAVVARLDTMARELGPGPYYYEFEGLEWHAGRWELLCVVVKPNVRESPRSTMGVTRLWFSADGRLERISPWLRDADGALHTDYAAALCVVGDDFAVVPAFFGEGVTVFDVDGRAVRHVPLPTSRVEGVDYDPAAGRLYLVRECAPPTSGDPHACADGPDSEGATFGVPLWLFDLPIEALLPMDPARGAGFRR